MTQPVALLSLFEQVNFSTSTHALRLLVLSTCPRACSVWEVKQFFHVSEGLFTLFVSTHTLPP